MSKLSDLLMSSGFGNPRDTDDDSDRTMQALHDAILEALFNGGVLPDDLLEKLFGDAAEGNEEQARDQLEELIQQIIERMKESGYISTPPDLEPEKARRAHGRRRRRRTGRGEVRGHRQGARLPRLPRAARSARLGRPQQRRPPRHARPVDRHRDQRRAEAVRVRRHDEPRRRPRRSSTRCSDGTEPAGRRDQRRRRPGSTSTIRT